MPKRKAEDQDGPDKKHLASTSQQEDFTFSDHVFQPSKIRSKYLHPDSRLLTENYPGNIKIESGQKIWNATGADLSKKETDMSPFYVKELQPTIVPIAPKRRTSLTSHQVSSKTPIKTPSKQSPKRPHNNDQRQDVDIISGKIHSEKEVNTINWSKQLKMTPISPGDYKKLLSLDTQTEPCIFYVDGDCKMMSRGAFIQYSSRFHISNPPIKILVTGLQRGCALLEYTSSAIQVLSLTSWLLLGKTITFGIIMKYSNNDCTVKLLTDLGILSHATVYNVLTKENARQKEELQKKDKMLVEQQKCHREEVEMLKTKMREEEAMMEKERDEMQRERDVMQNQILERERTIYQKDSAMAKIETSRSELKNQVLARQATLGKLEKELECPICKKPINMAMTTECGHAHCYECFEGLTRLRERPPCPCCRASVNRVSCSHVIDNCVSIVKESRQEEEAIQIGDETERESQGDPIQGEQGIPLQSETEESDDNLSHASSPSLGSFYCN